MEDNKWIQNVRSQTSRMNTMVAEMLELAKLDEGVKKTIKKRVNLSQEITETVLPFDNAIYLCRIRGTYLKSRFLNNSDYAKYSTITASQVKDNEYYYIVADSWTALYYWAQCEAVEIYDETTYARDLLAKYIQNGGWD